MLPGYRDSLSGAGITVGVTHDRFRIKLDYARALGSDVATDGHRSRVWISGVWLF
jgi:hemolysin activation/secretion protein